MAKQLPLPLPRETSQFSAPPQDLVEGMRRYTGGKYDPQGLSTQQWDPERSHAHFLHFRSQEGQALTPETRASYDQFRTEVGRQHAFATSPVEQGGLGYKMEVSAEDPYPTVEAAHADVVQNKRLKVLATATTGSHDLLTDDENDKFRFVHDLFGHIGTARGFSRNGEEAAYRSHEQMFPPTARPALATELRGQTAFLIGSGDFSSNTARNAPSFGVGTGPLPPPAPARRQHFDQGRLF